MSSITPLSPAASSHTWKLVKGQAGLSDPQACSAGSGQRLFTMTVVYGAGGHGLEGRGLNAQSPSRPSLEEAGSKRGVVGRDVASFRAKPTGRL